MNDAKYYMVVGHLIIHEWYYLEHARQYYGGILRIDTTAVAEND